MQKHSAKDETGCSKGDEEVFDQLIALNQRAFGLGRFSAAYHALAAAQSWASGDKDGGQLAIVENLAREELQWIDLHAPGYEHSSKSAGLRGHRSIFMNLEHQAHTARQGIDSRHHFEKLRRFRALNELH
jgi:hypothetical protein